MALKSQRAAQHSAQGSNSIFENIAAIRNGASQKSRPDFVYRLWADGTREWKTTDDCRIASGSPLAEACSKAWEDIAHIEALAKQNGDLALGYLAYEFGARSVCPNLSSHPLTLPLVHLAYYGNRATPLVPPLPRGLKTAPPRRAELGACAQQNKSEYCRALDRIRRYLEAGDVYQVNYTQAFSVESNLSGNDLFSRLSAMNPAPFSIHLDCGDFEILSSSPECFLYMEGDAVETFPIKGTAARGQSASQDAARKAALLQSPKDRAELLMICDLERHDLGQVCETGSVDVPTLFGTASFATVHHLFSHVRGRRKPGLTDTDILRAAFPSGSITGAPKKRAIEIIAELEPHARGPYTGAIGYFSAERSVWSVAMRTLIYQQGRVHFHSGGGVTIASDPEAEYAESLLKAAVLKEVCEIPA